MAESATPGAVKKGAGGEDETDDGGDTAVDSVSELVGDSVGGAAGIASAACDSTAAAAGLLISTGRCRPAAACCEGAGFARNVVGTG